MRACMSFSMLCSAKHMLIWPTRHVGASQTVSFKPLGIDVTFRYFSALDMDDLLPPLPPAPPLPLLLLLAPAPPPPLPYEAKLNTLRKLERGTESVLARFEFVLFVLALAAAAVDEEEPGLEPAAPTRILVNAS